MHVHGKLYCFTEVLKGLTGTDRQKTTELWNQVEAFLVFMSI